MKRALPSFVVVLAALIVGAFLWSALRTTVPPHIQPRERPRELRNFPVEEPLDRPSSDVEAAMIYLKRRDDDIRGIVEFAAYRAALEDASRRAAELATAQPTRSSGTRSFAWWEAIASCESGNTNAWRTGYYGLEAGSPVGGMSKADQLAWAERTYSQYGDSAWGCSPVAWQNVPAG